MTIGSHRPVLKKEAVKRALNAMRAAKPLPQEHPLRFFLIVREQLDAPDALAGEAAAEVAIFGHIAQIITAQLTKLRAGCGLPPPDVQCSQVDIQRDFRQNNPELEAWSALYHRYVCVGHDLQWQDIAALTQQNERMVRRRHTLGLQHLTHLLIQAEQTARRQRTEQRLRLALPHAHPPTLIGRDALIAQARQVLCAADPPRHVLLYGPQGIGKSVLAEAVAHTLIDEGCLVDLVWLRGERLSTDLSAALFEIATQLSLPLSAGADFRGALRAYLYRYPTLIVLDGAEDLVRNPETLDALLAELDTAIIVLTGRARPEHCATYTLAVPELPRDQAFVFLEWCAGRHAPVRDDWAAHFDAIWSAVGGNPSALQATLDATRSLPLAEVLISGAAERTYTRLWERLPTTAREVWLLTLFFPRGRMPYADLPDLLRLPCEALHQALGVLTRSALLELRPRDVDTFYAVSPHVASFLRALVQQRRALSPDENAHEFLQRHYPRRLTQLVRTPDARTALELLRLAEAQQFDMVLRWRGLYELGPQIMQVGLWTDWRRVLEAMPQNAPIEQQIWLQWMLGVAARWTGQLAGAREHLEWALSLCAPQTSERAGIQVELGVLYRYQGRGEETYRLLREALRFYQDHNLYAGIERCIHELAQLELEVEQPQRALSLLSRLERRTARTWGIVSQAYLQQGELDRALEAAEQVLALLPPQHPNRARTLVTLGQIALGRGEMHAAIENLLLAVDQLDQVRDTLGYARACNNLAAAYLHQPAEQRSVSAEELRQLLTQALRIQAYAGDEIGQAVSRRNLAWLERGDDVLPAH